MKKLIKDMLKIIEAQEQLLVAYRVGRRPANKTLDALDKRDAVLAEAHRVTSEPSPDAPVARTIQNSETRSQAVSEKVLFTVDQFSEDPEIWNVRNPKGRIVSQQDSKADAEGKAMTYESIYRDGYEAARNLFQEPTRE